MRTFLTWFFALGLLLTGIDAARERGRERRDRPEPTSSPSDSGQVQAMEDGTPIPPYP